jgi:hypothetical protein
VALARLTAFYPIENTITREGDRPVTNYFDGCYAQKREQIVVIRLDAL